MVRVLGHAPADAEHPHGLPVREGEGPPRDHGPDLVGRCQGLVEARVGQDQKELLPPEAAKDVVLASALLDGIGELLEQLVAGQVAVGVVVVLEVVDVEEEDRQPGRGSLITVAPAIVRGAGGAVDQLREGLLHVPLVEHLGEAVHLRVDPQARVRGRRVEGLGPRLGDEAQRGLAVPYRLPGTSHRDQAQRLLVEDEGRNEVGPEPGQGLGAGLDAALGRLRGEVLAGHHDLRLRCEPELAAVHGDLGPKLVRGALRGHGRHHEAGRRVRLLLRPPAFDEHDGVGRLQAALDDMQDRPRDLPLSEGAEEVARQVRKLLQELAQRLLVLLELGVVPLELTELVSHRVRSLVGFPRRRAQTQDEWYQKPGRDQASEEERDQGLQEDSFTDQERPPDGSSSGTFRVCTREGGNVDKVGVTDFRPVARHEAPS